MFDLNQLDDAKIIFNHIPKAGGSSLYFFFQDLFGEDKVFRAKTRNVETEIVTMEDLSDEDKKKHILFQGHFKYGYHKLFDQKCFYFGIIRDPVERIVSNYYYTKSKGVKKAKEYANSVTLEEFFENRVQDAGERLGWMQTEFLTGTDKISKAKPIIQNEYFLCCTTKQLNSCQILLASVYSDKKMKAMKRNVSGSDEKSGEVLDQLKEKYKDLFEVDYKMLRFIRNFYNERRTEIQEQLDKRKKVA